LKNLVHDFAALTAEIIASNVQDIGVEPEVFYCADYPRAISEAIDQRDYIFLFRLLDAREPIHPCLGPALAEAFRAPVQGKKVGATPLLTTYEVGVMQSSMIQMRHHRQTVTKMLEKISTAWNVDYSKAKRSWDAIEEKPSRFDTCKLNDCRLCKLYAEMSTELK